MRDETWIHIKFINMNKINTHKKLETPLQIKTFQFAVRIVKLCQHIKSTKQEFEMTKQLFRSGTNPGAMVREALNAESGLDFLHKLGVAQKETGETQYWLELMEKTDYLNKAEFDSIYADS
jgi:four helix bundle protein